MLVLLLLCGAISTVACALLLRHARGHARRYALTMPQRFHAGHVPRLGGVAMLAACAVGWAWMVVGEPWFSMPNSIRFSPEEALSWGLVAAIATAAGVGEDLSHRLAARWRLVITLAAAIVGVAVLGLSIDRLGLAWLDAFWQANPWPGFLLAVVAVGGLPHAFNLIDGYNGLAGTVAAICCFALAYVSLLLGDRELAAIALVLAGSTAGFLLWNYPRGLIFAGDGGAYLWGVVIATLSVTLVQRYPQVSPWFPVLLLIYPVWETLFSIYRKLVRGQSPGVADALHFHQLIYRRIVRGVFHDDEAARMLMRNNRTSPYLWGFTLLTVIPAVLFFQSTTMLVLFTAVFVVGYVWVYFSIVRFRVPRWLKSRT